MGSAQNFLSFLIPFVVFFISLPSRMAVLLYRSVLIANSGKHMGSYQMPPRRNALIPFSILSVFFMSAPRLDISCYLPTGRVSGCKRGSSSGRSSTSCRSSRSWLSLSWSHLLSCIVLTGITGRRSLSGASKGGLPRTCPLFLRTGRSWGRCKPRLNLLCGFYSSLLCSSWPLFPFVNPNIYIFRF
jgi:hypothetical protein